MVSKIGFLLRRDRRPVSTGISLIAQAELPSGTVLAYFIMPESSQRSAAEIQEMFVDHVPLRRWKGYKTAVERDLETRQQME
jgi:hypothetical protein